MSVKLLDIQLAHLDTLPDRRRFEWEEVGRGDPMLWIEGGPGFPAHLARPDAALFARWFKVHLVNAPGCGRTAAPDRREQYDLANHVEFFDDVRRALGLGPVTLVGHSWGALVAVAYAALRPDAVRRLIVLDGYAGGGSVDPSEADAERERAFDRVRHQPWFDDAHRALDAAFALRSPTEQELVDTFVPAWPLYFACPELPSNRAHIERLGRELRFNVDVSAIWDERFEAEDHRDLAARVTAPTLIVVGEHDFICGPTWNRALSAAIPRSLYVEMANVGHVPQYEDPEQLASIVGSWLAEDGLRPQLNSKNETARIR
jgi:pimeloyl-ACP methyl ester carboxylesterase